jgi:Dyp-type peroxidase family
MNEQIAFPIEPIEPVLELDDIQGAVIPGFLKQYQTLVGINSGASLDQTKDLRHFVRILAKMVTPARTALEDRRTYKSLKLAKKLTEKKPVAFIGIGFSYSGLSKLTPSAASIPSEAFRLGLAGRSQLLGDPPEQTAPGNPANWIVGGKGGDLDALVLISGDTPECVAEATAKIGDIIKQTNVAQSYLELGGVRPDMPGHEHFGFDDGISQPGIRGRATTNGSDFITDRHIDPKQKPEHWLYGYPGQNLLWPGQFVFGYPGASPDPLRPGPIISISPDWTKNGSFLVFRRLRQDVSLFWKTMKSQAEELSKHDGFKTITEVELAAKLVGRWPSGAPVNRTPDKDDPKLGSSPFANNYFRFDSDTQPLPLVGENDKFKTATADPAGTTCPWAAHIRKVNTRDSGSDMGTQDSTYKRRLLRVGVPFGKPLADPYGNPEDDPEKGNRGLLFLSIQSSIEDQFEFLCSRWANDPTRPKTPGGHDFIIGQNGAPDEFRQRSCTIFGDGYKQEQLNTVDEWVIPTGGGYFILPSLTALRDVLGVS